MLWHRRTPLLEPLGPPVMKKLPSWRPSVLCKGHMSGSSGTINYVCYHTYYTILQIIFSSAFSCINIFLYFSSNIGKLCFCCLKQFISITNCIQFYICLYPPLGYIQKINDPLNCPIKHRMRSLGARYSRCLQCHWDVDLGQPWSITRASYH